MHIEGVNGGSALVHPIKNTHIFARASVFWLFLLAVYAIYYGEYFLAQSLDKMKTLQPSGFPTVFFECRMLWQRLESLVDDFRSLD